MSDTVETKRETPAFDFDAFPPDTLFYDRREGLDRRSKPAPPPAPADSDPGDRPAPERRAKKERRRRVDPTTFEKSYTEDEMEFMTAMQRFKVQTGRPFPTHGEVLRVAASLGYRKFVPDEPDGADESDVPAAEAP